MGRALSDSRGLSKPGGPDKVLTILKLFSLTNRLSKIWESDQGHLEANQSPLSAFSIRVLGSESGLNLLVDVS
ncbi:hypothetical protein M408DRAFT_334376 [Serendipita vermifera MAFF 305830]|uniref:Uncharacterized protein n=1 Tax=Serendipita vermifera MAFF 305830 TaxID=933852 RepID=A0A0C3AHD6_SERVB|nr:hypothetical protein M408DRAFT_334376 [Serendipita vermifera MAFF 305830]